MANLPPASLRAAIETALSDELVDNAVPPWTVSRMNWRLFPGQDPQNIEVRSFAVGIPSTEPFARQVAGKVAAHSQVVVKFTAKLRADNHVSDEDTAMASEVLFHDLLLGSMPCPLTVDRIERDAVGDGTVFLGTFTCTALHNYTV